MVVEMVRQVEDQVVLEVVQAQLLPTSQVFQVQVGQVTHPQQAHHKVIMEVLLI
jgi:hypothetical protein